MKLLVVLLLAVGLVFGAEPYVEKIQESVQVLRDGKRLPMGAGSVLKEGDEVITNAGSKAYLFFPNRSRIKLGEKSRFKIERSNDSGKRYEAVLSPLTGAFRYTSEKLAKLHKIDIKLKTATIGIRGTDIWGKVGDDEAFVILIEGNVSLEDRDVTLHLDQYRSVYDAQTQQVGEISEEALKMYAAQTEIEEKGE